MRSVVVNRKAAEALATQLGNLIDGSESDEFELRFGHETPTGVIHLRPVVKEPQDIIVYDVSQ